MNQANNLPPKGAQHGCLHCKHPYTPEHLVGTHKRQNRHTLSNWELTIALLKLVNQRTV